MKTLDPLKKLCCCATAILLFLLTNTSFAQTLTTDKSDYHPGEIVNFSGSGFSGGETVTLQVVHADGSGDNSEPTHQPWDITANDDGTFTATWEVNLDYDQIGATLLATADGQSGAHAEALFTDACGSGNGVVTVTSLNGSCVAGTPPNGGGPFNWEVAGGQSYTMTITGATECDGDVITVFVQDSKNGNFCFNATGEAGSHNFSGTFIAPGPICSTNPISYKCGANQSCDNSGAIDARGPDDACTVHLRSAQFTGNCEFTGNTTDCLNATCTLELSETHTDVSSLGGSDGSINVTVSPAGTYSYSWTGPNSFSANTEDISGLAAGTYVLTVDGQCLISVTLIENDGGCPPPGVDITPDGPTTFCEGGSVELCASGATSYTWEGPDGFTSNDACITVSEAGTYTVTGHGPSPCTQTVEDEIEISVNPATVIVSCSGGDLGCNPTLPPAEVAPTFTGTNASATYEDGEPESTGGCGWKITRTWTVTGDCGTETCDQVYTYTLSGAPQLANLPEGGPLGCNPTPPTCDENVTASNDCGSLEVTCTPGDIEEDGCSRSQKFTYSASGCGGEASEDVTYTWTVSGAPQLANLPEGGPLGCNPTPPTCDENVTASNDCGSLEVTCTPGDIEEDGCSRSQKFTYSASGCGGEASEDVTYTWTVSGAPQLANLPEGGPLGCNPTPPTCDENVTASNDCGSLEVTCTPGDIEVDGCSRSQKFTYSASGCGGEASEDVTYTWTVATAPVFNCSTGTTNLGCNATAPTCSSKNVTASNQCGSVDVTCTPGTISYNGCSRSQDFVYSAEVCGLSNSITRTYTWSVSNSVSITIPNPLPICGTTGNKITATVSGAGTVSATTGYAWTVSGTGWSLTGGQGTPTITYTAGNSGTTGTFTVKVTNNCGCTATDTKNVNVSCEEHCGYTQGFYGGTGKTCSGQTNTALVPGLLPITIGCGTRTISFSALEASCLTSKMPSGTTAGALPVGNITCTDINNGNATFKAKYLKNGKFITVLLGQTIALQLNMKVDLTLGGVAITGKYLTTYTATSCSSGKAKMPLSSKTTTIPSSVINYLNANTGTYPGGATVGNVLSLANKALGACYTGTNPSLSDIVSALDAINQGFDGCRILGKFSNTLKTEEELIPDASSSATSIENLSIFPNPAVNQVNVTFTSSSDMNATVDVYNVNGVLVSREVTGVFTTGESSMVQLDASQWSQGVYFVRISQGDKSAYGKFIIVK